MPYAKGTEVSVDRSRAEIENILARAGAASFQSGWHDSPDGSTLAAIQFRMRERFIRFKLPIPSRDDKQFSRTPGGKIRVGNARLEAWEAERRRRWRALLLCIKSKLEAVESGISEFDAEFLAHIYDPHSGQTIGEYYLPILKEGRPLGLPAPAAVD